MPALSPSRLLALLVVVALASPATAASDAVDVAPGSAAPPRSAVGDVTPVGTWPLDPRPEVVRAFDPPDTRWGPGHRGADLLGALGQPVRAALPGSVRFAGPVAGRGVVVVDHGPTRTTYEPVVPTLRVGDPVAAGQVLGRLTSPGSHCLPRLCLHWGWRRGEVYLDPLDLVGGGPVRLLPVWATTATSSGIRVSPRSPYAGWRPPALAPGTASPVPGWAQARGCACW